MPPARPHVDERAAQFFRSDLGIGPGSDDSGLAFGRFEQLAIADKIGHAEVGHARLPCAEKFSRAA